MLYPGPVLSGSIFHQFSGTNMNIGHFVTKVRVHRCLHQKAGICMCSFTRILFDQMTTVAWKAEIQTCCHLGSLHNLSPSGPTAITKGECEHDWCYKSLVYHSCCFKHFHFVNAKILCGLSEEIKKVPIWTFKMGISGLEETSWDNNGSISYVMYILMHLVARWMKMLRHNKKSWIHSLLAEMFFLMNTKYPCISQWMLS